MKTLTKKVILLIASLAVVFPLFGLSLSFPQYALAATSGTCTAGTVSFINPADGIAIRGNYTVSFSRNGGCVDDVDVYWGKRSVDGVGSCSLVTSWTNISTVSNPGTSANPLDTTTLTDATDYCFRLKPTGGADGRTTDITVDNTVPTIPVANIVGTTIQGANDTIEITFSENVSPADADWTDGDEFSAIESPDGTALNMTGATYSYNAGTFKLTITLNETNAHLKNGNAISVTPALNAIIDQAQVGGNKVANVEVDGTTNNTGDVVQPTVTSVLVLDNDLSTTINTGDGIRVAFDEKMDTSTITVGTLDTDLGLSANTFGTAGNGTSIAWTNGDATLTVTLGSDATVVDGNTINPAVTVKDLPGNADNSVNKSIDDTFAPAVNLTAPVSGNIVKGTKVITFTDNDPGATNSCSVDNSNWTACTSGVTTLSNIPEFGGLGEGNFTLYLKGDDGLGNVGTDNEGTIVKDTVAPTVVLSDNHPDAIVRDADSVTITATFTEVNGLNGTPTITIGDHIAGAAMSATGNPLIWTYAWDVPAGHNHAEAVSISAVDNAGNANAAATGKTSYTVDNVAPTVSAGELFADESACAGAACVIGEVIKFTWDNSVATGDGNSDEATVKADISNFGGNANQTLYDDGTNGDASGGDDIYTYNYTVIGNGDDGTYSFTATVTDIAGNSTGPVTSTDTAPVDNIVPTPTDANITVSKTENAGGAGVANPTDVMTVVWNASAGGDNHLDVVSGNASFADFGGGAVALEDDGAGGTCNDTAAGDDIWCATYAVLAGAIDDTDNDVTLTSVTDDAGNVAGNVTDGTQFSVDNKAPTVTDAKISIAGGTGPGGKYKVGDTITVTWDNSAGGDNNADLASSTANLSGWGGGGAVAMTDTTACGGTASDNIYEACYTLVAGAIDAVNINATVTAVDDAGNSTGPTSDTSNATVDTQLPVVTDGNISIAGGTGTGGAYKIGDTITVTWDNSAGGDNNADLASATANLSGWGGNAAAAMTDTIACGGVLGDSIYEACYTILGSEAIDGTGINASVTATDDAGNTKTTGDTTGATVDTIAPNVVAATITATGCTGTGGACKNGDTPTLQWDPSAETDTITSATFDGSNFRGGDNALAGAFGGGVWSTTLSGALSAQDDTGNTITVTVVDNAGNSTGPTTSAVGYVVDTNVPTVTAANISVTGASGTGGAFIIGDSPVMRWDVTTEGEADTLASVSFNGANFRAGDTARTGSLGGGVYTASLSGAMDSQEDTNNNTTVTVTDNAGNVKVTAGTNNYSIDTVAPAVDAGTDKVVKVATLQDASATDTNGIASYLWSKFSGPGTISFDNNAIQDPTVSADTDGAYVVQVLVTDGKGNTNTDTYNFTWDTVNPNTGGAITGGTAGDNGWYTSNVTFTITPADPAPSSGIASTSYCIDTADVCAPGSAYTVPVTVSTESATNYVRWTSTDNAGNVQATQSSGIIKIDKTAPAIPFTDNASGTWTTSDTLTVNPSDGLSGMAETRSIISATTTCDGTRDAELDLGPLGPTVTANNEVTYYNKYICFRGKDNAGLKTYNLSAQIDHLDTSNPSINITDNVSAGWVTSETVTQTADFSTSGKATYDWMFVADATACDGALGWPGTAINSGDSINITDQSQNGNDVCFRAIDNATNTAYLKTSNVIQVDITLPTITITDDAAGVWGTSDIIAATMGDAHSGVDAGTIRYKFLANAGDCVAGNMGAGTTAYNSGDNLTISSNHNDYICFGVSDNVGNAKYLSTAQLMVDVSNPTTSGAITGGTLGTNGWYTTNVTYTLTPADNLSGVASTDYCVDTADTCNPGAGTNVPGGAAFPVTVSTESATNYVRWRSTDNAGNVQATQSSGIIKIDKTNPTTGGAVTAGPDGANGWYISDVTWRLVPADALSGVVSTKYCQDTAGACDPATGTTVPGSPANIDVTISTESATNHVRWYSIDDAGLQQATQDSGAIKLDKTKPTVDAGLDEIRSSTYMQNATTSDALSGMPASPSVLVLPPIPDVGYVWSKASGPGSLNFSDINAEDPMITADTEGVYTVQLDASDNAGNYDTDTFTLKWGVPPIVVNSGPSGTDTDGNVTLTVTTEKNANCSYATEDKAYSAMTAFATTGTTAHSQALTLTNGNYQYYARCQNSALIPMTTSAVIEFTVAIPGDSTPPTISLTSVTPSQTGAAVVFQSNENGAGYIRYGLGNDYGYESGTEALTAGVDATVNITGLVCNTLYHYSIFAQDSAGNFSNNLGDATFTTSGCGLDVTPPVISLTSVTPSQTGAAVVFQSNENATGWIRYGLGTDYGNETEYVILAAATNKTVNLTGLTCNTTYHYSLYARDGSGNESHNLGDANFNTSSCSDTSAPVITLSGPTGTDADGNVTLAVTTDENATCKYDTADKTYANLASTFGTTGTTNHSQAINGLTDGVYQYYVRCQDGATNTMMESTVIQFTVLIPGDAVAPTISLTSVTPSQTGAAVVFQSNENGAGYVRYGLGNDYGYESGTEALTAGVDATVNITGLVCNTLYHYSIFAQDSAGNFSNNLGDATFTTNACSDTTPPSINSIRTDKPSYRATQDPNVTVTVVEDDTAATVTVNGVAAAEAPAGTWTYTFAHSGVIGTYSLMIQATDASANMLAREIAYAIVPDDATDITPPAITSISTDAPSYRQTQDGNVNVTVIEDNTAVTVTVNGSGATEGVPGTWTVSVAHPATVGTYSLIVQATDAVGNATLSEISYLVVADTDTVAPTITPGAVTPAQTGASLVFQINENGWGWVKYGLGADYGNVTSMKAMTTGVDQTFTLSGLTCATTYHYSLFAKDGSNNEASTADTTFATTACTPGDTTPPTISLTSVTPSQTGAAVVFQSNEAGTGWIRYGLGADYGNESEFVTLLAATNKTIDLTGLTCNTTYHYSIYAKDASNNESHNLGDAIFTTTACSDTTPPVVTASGPSGTDVDGNVTLTATTNEAATCRYAATDQNYATMTNFTTTGTTNHSENINGLTNGNYQYYVRCQDGAANAMTVSAVIEFTVGIPPADTTAPAFVSSTPTNAATSVSAAAGAVTVTYSEALTLVTEPAVTIIKAADASSVKNGVATVAGNDLTINYNALEYGTSYKVTVAVGALSDGVNPTTVKTEIYFTTQSATAPDITGLSISAVTHNSANLNWAIDDNTSVTGQYRVNTTAYAGAWTAFPVAGTSGTVALAGLTNNTVYYYQVRFDRNGTKVNSVPMTFQTSAGSTGIVVDSINMVKSYATADNTYANGWEWKIAITANNFAENGFAMKFAQWTSGANTLDAANNMQYAVDADNDGAISGVGAEAWQAITANAAYPADVGLISDNDVTRGGRQFTVFVQTKVPAGTAAGSFGTSYGVRAQ